MTHLIEASRLCRTFTTSAETVTAVRDVSITVDQGDFVCLRGASGSGKTTLIRLFAGLLAPQSGDLLVDGVDMTSMNSRQSARFRLETVGVVFQDVNLIPEFSAWENVALPLEARGVDPDEAEVQAKGALERVGVAELSSRRPAELSGGQRQRVGVARAIVTGARILLADEPTGALDSKNSTAIFELFSGLCADDGYTAVVASHDDISRTFATVNYEMLDGSIVQ